MRRRRLAQWATDMRAAKSRRLAELAVGSVSHGGEVEGVVGDFGAAQALLAMGVVVAFPAPALPYATPFPGCRHYVGAFGAGVCAAWLMLVDREVRKWKIITAGQPDDKRHSGALRGSSVVVVAVSGFLTSMGEMAGRVCAEPHALRSLPGCQVQGPHVDYDEELVADIPAGGRMPASVLLSLESGSRLFLGRGLGGPDVLVEFGPGDVFVFCGDVPHYGSGYESLNTRVHLYLDLEGRRRMRKSDSAYLY